MRVTQLPPVLLPGRVHDLLVTGELSVAVVPAAETPQIVLTGRVPSEGAVLVGGAGTGLPRLIGEIARGLRLEALRGTDGEWLEMPIPTEVRRWLLEPAVLWSLLALAAPADSTSGSLSPPRRVDSGEVLRYAGTGGEVRAWRAALALSGSRNDNGGATVSLLVVAREAADHPPRSTVAGLHRLRDAVRRAGYPRADVQMRRQDVTAVPAGSAMMRLDGSLATVYWPRAAFRTVMKILGGEDLRTRDAQPVALLRLLDGELTDRGLLRTVELFPRSAVERRARHALRTVGQLIRADGVAKRSLIDTAYRSGTLYRDVAYVAQWVGAPERDALRMGFGTRRWEQITVHAARRPPDPGPLASTVPDRGGDARLPWVQLCHSAGRIAADLADRCLRAGQRPPAPTVDVVRRFYLDPRGERMRRVWRERVRDGALERALEGAFLSRLKKELPRLPRQVLIAAAAGTSPACKQRIGAAFSRRGRDILAEDVAAMERVIDQAGFADWDRLLAARTTLLRLYARRSATRASAAPDQRSTTGAPDGPPAPKADPPRDADV